MESSGVSGCYFVAQVCLGPVLSVLLLFSPPDSHHCIIELILRRILELTMADFILLTAAVPSNHWP